MTLPDTGLKEKGSHQCLKDQCEPKDGHREPKEAESRRGVIKEAVLLLCREDSQDDGKRYRNHLGDENQLQRVPDSAGEFGPDRFVTDCRGAELVEDRVFQPEEVLNEQRIFVVQ